MIDREGCVPGRPWGAKRGLLISQFTQRERASAPASPCCSGERKEESGEHEEREGGATRRVEKTRLPESRLSLLHSSRIDPLSPRPFAY